MKCNIKPHGKTDSLMLKIYSVKCIYQAAWQNRSNDVEDLNPIAGLSSTAEGGNNGLVGLP